MTTHYTGEEASLLVRRNFGTNNNKKRLKKQSGSKKERKLCVPKNLGLRAKFDWGKLTGQREATK